MRTVTSSITSFIFSLIVFAAFGQVNDARAPETPTINYKIKKKNAVYIEALGNALFYSINYERILFNEDRTAICLRAGYSYMPKFDFTGDGIYGSVSQIPLELNIIYTQKHIFEKLGWREEIGIGATLQRSIDNTVPEFPEVNHYCLAFLRIGIRYQRSEGGWFYRIAFTPNFYDIDDDSNPNGVFYFFPYGGVSIGRNF